MRIQSLMAPLLALAVASSSYADDAATAPTSPATISAPSTTTTATIPTTAATGDVSAPTDAEPTMTDSAPTKLNAAEGGLDFADLAFEDVIATQLISMPTKSGTLEADPSLVSIITADEIALLGVRDLKDLLALVPGFQFAVDVAGVVGVGYRGVWAQEGKILLLLDGQPMNELSFDGKPVWRALPCRSDCTGRNLSRAAWLNAGQRIRRTRLDQHRGPSGLTTYRLRRRTCRRAT